MKNTTRTIGYILLIFNISLCMPKNSSDNSGLLLLPLVGGSTGNSTSPGTTGPSGLPGSLPGTSLCRTVNSSYTETIISSSTSVSTYNCVYSDGIFGGGNTFRVTCSKSGSTDSTISNYLSRADFVNSIVGKDFSTSSTLTVSSTVLEISTIIAGGRVNSITTSSGGFSSTTSYSGYDSQNRYTFGTLPPSTVYTYTYNDILRRQITSSSSSSVLQTTFWDTNGQISRIDVDNNGDGDVLDSGEARINYSPITTQVICVI